MQATDQTMMTYADRGQRSSAGRLSMTSTWSDPPHAIIDLLSRFFPTVIVAAGGGMHLIDLYTY
jgi:hypothetical protein